MQHTIQITPNNFIELHVSGDITLDDVNTIGQQVINNMTLIEDKGLAVNILVDYTEAKKTEDLAVALAKAFAKNQKFHRIAGFAGSEENRKIVTDLAKSINAEDKIRMFETREEAEAWLSE